MLAARVARTPTRTRLTRADARASRPDQRGACNLQHRPAGAKLVQAQARPDGEREGVIRQRVELRRGTGSSLRSYACLTLHLRPAGARLRRGDGRAARAPRCCPLARIDRISGYRTDLPLASPACTPNGLHHRRSRLIAGFGGLIVFLGFAFLTLRGAAAAPLHANRGAVAPTRRDAAAPSCAPAPIERVAETRRAGRTTDVIGVTSRLSDDGVLNVDVGLRRRPGRRRRRSRTFAGPDRRPARPPPASRNVPVHVTLTGYERSTRRGFAP